MVTKRLVKRNWWWNTNMNASSENISTHCEFLGTNNLSHALCRSDYHCAKGEGPGMISLSYLIVNSSAVGNNLTALAARFQDQ